MAVTVDLETDDVETLRAAQRAIEAEIVRRERLSLIPEQITALVAAYVADGGDPDDLTTALTPEEGS